MPYYFYILYLGNDEIPRLAYSDIDNICGFIEPLVTEGLRRTCDVMTETKSCKVRYLQVVGIRPHIRAV